MTRTEILIVGAGFAGLPIALACAHSGWRVTLVDQQTATESLPTDPLDQRCTAISGSSVELLNRWGLSDAIESNAQPIGKVHISQKGYLGTVRLNANELGVSALGQVVENRHWIASLAEKVNASPHIEWLRGETLASIHYPNDNALVAELISGKSIEACLLIAADGVNSTVGTVLGVDARTIDFKQHALMSTLRLSLPHESTAYERFTSSGPLALLPRPNNLMSMVWCLPTADADHWAQADEASLIDHLQHLIGFRLGRIQAIGPKVLVPLRRKELLNQTQNRVIFLGNAARLLHPVAGQGFNLVLRDLACLLDLIGLQNNSAAEDPGASCVLDKFVAIRRKDQQQTVSLTDSLATGFLGESKIPAHLRGLGLIGLDFVNPLKRQFAQKAMGFTG